MKRLLGIFCILILGSCGIDDNFTEVCFVGDSITFLWDVEYYFPSFVTHKHGVGGARIENLDGWDLSECRGIPTVFLMGTNNIGWVSYKDSNAVQSREAFVKELMPRLDRISANPLIYVSILPRNSKDKQGNEANKNINLQNKLILDSLENSGLSFKYVNAFDAFLDSNFEIKKTLFTDGVHLSAEGYELLTDLVQKKL